MLFSFMPHLQIKYHFKLDFPKVELTYVITIKSTDDFFILRKAEKYSCVLQCIMHDKGFTKLAYRCYWLQQKYYV